MVFKIEKKETDETQTICKICGTNETNNPDHICDDCKFSIISSDDIPPNM